MHIDLADQHPDVPEPKDRPPCDFPECDPRTHWQPGYGLAGGGMGLYTYCDLCERVIDKVQDHPQGEA